MSDEIEKIMIDTLEKEANIGKIKADLEEAKANRAYNSYKKRQKQEQDFQEAMDDNIVKRVCKELGITQRELAERMEIPESTIARWKNGDIPRLADLYLNALLENVDLKTKLEAIKKAHKIMSSL
nr:MAG TPA: helix-turn-helix domain protein [Caudoviricetes sp.]